MLIWLTPPNAIQVDDMRPEFKSGLHALTRFVSERTQPKQVGSKVMTGPILACVTQPFLDALNKGAMLIAYYKLLHSIHSRSSGERFRRAYYCTVPPAHHNPYTRCSLQVSY
ncbi:uncharacterized protein LOC143557085 [Bidens hawaiensis]|uniref:uncharacterized protein LOC143557085 n=1 Tax=Bidens hawaiensis TaxID=980011 RepID=UPI0040498AAC